MAHSFELHNLLTEESIRGPFDDCCVFMVALALSASQRASDDWQRRFAAWCADAVRPSEHDIYLDFVQIGWFDGDAGRNSAFAMEAAIGVLQRAGWWPQSRSRLRPSQLQTLDFIDHSAATLHRWAQDLNQGSCAPFSDGWTWQSQALNQRPPRSSEIERCPDHGLYFIPSRVRCLLC